MSIFAVNELG